MGGKMTLKDFIEACKSGCFIDYDGYGYYGTDTEELKNLGEVYLSQYRKLDKTQTHIYWYNR